MSMMLTLMLMLATAGRSPPDDVDDVDDDIDVDVDVGGITTGQRRTPESQYFSQALVIHRNTTVPVAPLLLSNT